MESIIFYSAAAILLLCNRSIAVPALKKSVKSFTMLLPRMSFIFLLMGLILALMPPEVTSGMIGSESGIIGTILALIIGSIAIIPGFIAFPLGVTLVENGAGLSQTAGFIAALMGVGLMTLPLESKYFGKKFALYRNAGAIIMAAVFVVLVAVLLEGRS